MLRCTCGGRPGAETVRDSEASNSTIKTRNNGNGRSCYLNVAWHARCCGCVCVDGVVLQVQPLADFIDAQGHVAVDFERDAAVRGAVGQSRAPRNGQQAHGSETEAQVVNDNNQGQPKVLGWVKKTKGVVSVSCLWR